MSDESAAPGATADSGPGKEETKVQKEAGKDHGQPKPTATASQAPSAKKRGSGPGGGDAKRQKASKGVVIAVGDRGVYFTTMNSGSVDKAKRDLQQMLEAYKVGSETELHTVLRGGTCWDLKQGQIQHLRLSNSEATKGMGFLKLMNEGGASPSEALN
ncbi:unnamed protein product [Cladocopium goreaui]|uniref:Uncharacterized protein n=1 Tax=Cladocopium goreaui TaxID=2562237 RepID=A0A9P1GM23_9DINO|nr:unnamed protein product [Cladocopium goreaui]